MAKPVAKGTEFNEGDGRVQGKNTNPHLHPTSAPLSYVGSSVYFLPHPSPTAGSWSHWPGGTLLGRRPTLRRRDLGKSPAQALEAGALRLGWKFWGPQYPECDPEEAHRPQVCIFP